MKTYQVAILALVAVVGCNAFFSDVSQIEGGRSRSRKLLQENNALSHMVTYQYPPPPPSREFMAALGRQQRLRDLLYGSLTPPGMQAMISPDVASVSEAGQGQEVAPGEDLTTAPAPAPAMEEDGVKSKKSKKSKNGEEDEAEVVKDGGPFLVLGVSFILITGIGGAIYSLYYMRDMPWLNEVIKRIPTQLPTMPGAGGGKVDKDTKGAEIVSRSDVLKAKMAKLRESINNSA